MAKRIVEMFPPPDSPIIIAFFMKFVQGHAQRSPLYLRNGVG